MNVWRLITHHLEPEEVLNWSRKQNRIAIGWGAIGDLRKSTYSSPQDISDAISKKYPHLKNAGAGGRCLWHFLNDMNVGDLVILSTGHMRKLVMKVDSDYEWKSSAETPLNGDYQNQRKANIVHVDPNELWKLAGGRPANGDNIRWTLIRCSKTVDGL